MGHCIICMFLLMRWKLLCVRLSFIKINSLISGKLMSMLIYKRIKASWLKWQIISIKISSKHMRKNNKISLTYSRWSLNYPLIMLQGNVFNYNLMSIILFSVLWKIPYWSMKKENKCLNSIKIVHKLIMSYLLIHSHG